MFFIQIKFLILYEVFKDTLKLYIISEYVEGGELLARIDSKGLLNENESANGKIILNS